jgi:ribosomal-protein-alanine N-acetyltransferase
VSAVPKPGMHYRPMQPLDLPWIAALERELYPFPWSQGNFRDSLMAGYDCWVVCDGDEVVGYAILMVALDEAHLLNFAIASRCHRRGIGREFLGRVIEVARAKGVEVVYLEVRPSNVVARHLYRTAGFQQIAIRPGYYPAMQGREDALFLGLTL